MAVTGPLGAMQEGALLNKGALGRPGVFSGRESEWPAWHFASQGWIAMSQKIHAERKEAAEKLQPVTVVARARMTHARPSKLIRTLVLEVKERVMEMLRSHGENDRKDTKPIVRWWQRTQSQQHVQ